MIMKISNKINILSESTKLLTLGKVTTDTTDTLNRFFKNQEILDINENTLEVLNENFLKQFDIVIFSFTQADYDLYLKTNPIFPKNAIVIIEDILYANFIQHINQIATLLIGEFSQELLLEKIYNILAIKEANSLIKSKEKIINKFKDDTVNEDINQFLDQYSGSIMFINDDLNEQLTKLKDLEISKEIFDNISSNLIQFSSVLKENEQLEHLATVFNEFSEFLKTLDLESIQPAQYVAFDYLTTIVEDITIYIDELFVYRLFKDVRVFEDSLENNIGYFEASLFGLEENENEENLEFF